MQPFPRVRGPSHRHRRNVRMSDYLDHCNRTPNQRGNMRNCRRHFDNCMQQAQYHTRLSSWEVLARPSSDFATCGKDFWKRHAFGVANSWLDLIL
jgi:hypothetical protein